MASVKVVKTISRSNPTMIDKLNSIVFGDTIIHEFDTSTSYNPDDIMYKVDSNDVLHFYQAIAQTSGTFNPDMWEQITILDLIGSSSIISETTPTSSNIATWYRPISYKYADVDAIISEMNPNMLTHSISNNTASITGLVSTLPDSQTKHFFGSVKTPKTISGKLVTSIGDNAFRNVKGITNLTITDNILEIGAASFKPISATETDNSYYLTSIAIGYGLSIIPVNAFANQKNITEMEFPATIETISDGAFDNCTSLESITVLNRDTAINANAFTNCTSLTDVYGLAGSTAEDFATLKGYTFHTI